MTFPLLGNSGIFALVIVIHVFIAFIAVGGVIAALFLEIIGVKKKDNDYLRFGQK
jgi:cytochrome bd-type quinol oxidase subunit 1